MQPDRRGLKEQILQTLKLVLSARSLKKRGKKALENISPNIGVFFRGSAAMVN